MTQVLAATGAFFRDRDLFVHDGSKLRRFRISAPVQGVLFIAFMTLVAWSSYATARFVNAVPAALSTEAAPARDYAAQVAQLTAETERRVQALEQRQIALAAALAGGSEGIDPASLKRLGYTVGTNGGVGGPANSSTGNPTFKQLFMSWKKLDTLTDAAIAIPSDKPVRTAEFMSAYGHRSDPFERRVRMHEGIDLAAPLGTPIHSTAEGIVVRAGWNSGGYGNLVEVDHGRGIITRYGHLSAVLVRPGERVTRGQQLGRMGSTGRSTGSHLHYEVRIDGRSVNPIPFMKTTDYVVAMQRRANAAPMEALAMGGPGGGGR